MEFRVEGVPVAQPRQRQRVAVIGGHTRAMNYTPTKHPVNVFKSAVAKAAAEAIQQPFDGPVGVALLFVMPRPKSLIWKLRPMPRIWCNKKPDADNLSKAALDGMAGCWRDDSQVCSLTVVKQIAAGDEQPHVIVRVESL